jgi:uncharacterized protein YggE
MNRLITVKETGMVSIKPDLIIICMNLESHQEDYEKTMQLATDSVNALLKTVESAGFDKSDVQTPDIKPDNINVSDTVSFVWEFK